MKQIIELIELEIAKAFEQAGYGKELAKVTISNRPDLCEYQCNGAMAGAKTYHKAPIMIAEDVVAHLQGSDCFAKAEAVKPGFTNLNLKEEFVADYVNQMAEDDDLGLEQAENPEMIVIDYGGPNVAKPLHVGHLRSAVIGESVKRMFRKMGHKVLGDIHLGDWGYQMGLIITELKKRKPELPYYDESYTGDYPEEAPFTISELEEIYPTASGYAKEHEDYREEALHATYLLQNGHRGYRALWNHIVNISVADIKKNYQRLNVEFDLWKGESDAQKYIPDKRQEMHFTQVFRAAKKTGIVPASTELKFIGFGTMNGKDGKPFKIREGGVMRLENLIAEINQKMYQKITDNRTIEGMEAEEAAQKVGLAALKYGDLSNQAGKDYVFDIDRFTSFEGNTGPYILYTIVRIKSILNKYKENGGVTEDIHCNIPSADCEKALMLEVGKYNAVMKTAAMETAPHKICAYIYDLANVFNRFYHETKILAEEDEAKKAGYIALLTLTKEVLESCIDVLGFEAPERM